MRQYPTPKKLQNTKNCNFFQFLRKNSSSQKM